MAEELWTSAHVQLYLGPPRQTQENPCAFLSIPDLPDEIAFADIEAN
jgi:hypothetical protein